MNVLHVLADHKWTGPAEHVADLCDELQKLGVSIYFACQGDSDSALYQELIKRDVKKITFVRLEKKLRIVPHVLDVIKLKNLIESHRIDIVHVHQSTDHIIGGLASRFSSKNPKIVRTNHKDGRLIKSPASLYLHSQLIDGYLTFSKKILEEDKRYIKNSFLINPGLRLERYKKVNFDQSYKTRLGLDSDDFIMGVVMRVQKHRRFDLIIDAIDNLKKSFSNLKVFVLGRGTHKEELATKPVKQKGLDKIFYFAGYIRDRYLDALKAIDVLIYPVAGSDGTARALRECMALGKPSVVCNSGMLPEIIDDGVNGFVADFSGQSIAEKVQLLIKDKKLRIKMGQKAREKSMRSFCIKKQAKKVKKIYEQLIRNSKGA